MSTQTYDALGFDPAPGVPASVTQLVTALSKVGNQLNGAHGTLTRVGKSDGVWEGDAAAGFAKKVGELPKYLADGHASLIEAAHALNTWHTQLTDFQTLAARLEREAEEARRALEETKSNPDLRLAGRTFDTQAALDNAQKAFDHAAKRVDEATDDLNAIVSWTPSTALGTGSRILPVTSGNGYRSTPTRSTRSVTGSVTPAPRATSWPSSSPRR